MDRFHSLLIIIVVAIVTFLLRAISFILFKDKVPDSIVYLGKVLPYAVMVMLVIYAIRHVNIFEYSHGLPEIISLLRVLILHKTFHSTLLSIFGGTLIYMILIQVVF